MAEQANQNASNPKKVKKELTNYEKQQIETLKKINAYKEACEANIVGIIYKNPDLLRTTHLDGKEFTNNHWRVYFEIAKDLILVEKKNTLDDITVGVYLEKHPKLAKRYKEYGEYGLVEGAGILIKEENFDGYLNELRKWNSVIKLLARGFGVVDRLNEFCDMTAEEIYQEFEVFLNDTFVNVDLDVKSYDISDGLYELIDELDQGFAVGLPY